MSPKQRALLAALTGLVLAGSGLQIEAAYASPAPAVTLVGSLGHLPAASAIVLVEAKITGQRTAGVPRFLNDVVVARGAAHQLAVHDPGSLVPGAAEGRAAELRHRQLQPARRLWLPHHRARRSGAHHGTSPGWQCRGRRDRSQEGLRGPRMSGFRPMSEQKWSAVNVPRDPTVCHLSPNGGPWKKTTPIGQGHVATSADITDDYELSYTDDPYVNFGGSSSFSGGFQAVGNIQLDYHWGVSGGGTLGGTSAGFSKYLGSQYK